MEPPIAPERVTLRNGLAVVVRAIRPDDAPRLQAMHARLSPESIRLRFLATHPDLSEAEAAQFANVDYLNRMALVATSEGAETERILGVARYDLAGGTQPGQADVAIVVEDAYQGLGIGTLLITRLVDYARSHGVREFEADVSVENERVLRFVRRGGLVVEQRFEEGAWRLRIGLGGEA